jgi:triphosphoribosyl-dephospho-CoA synthase
MHCTLTTARPDSHPAVPMHALQIAAGAVWALREEAALTPKPGLVDRRGSGAHADMDLALLLRSAETLRPVFARIAHCAQRIPFGVTMRERLGAIGRAGETLMLTATGGVNTHRGAIWTLALLSAACATQSTPTLDAKEICVQAGRIARLPVAVSTQPSHGREMFLRHGVRGARGEAENGFPSLHAVGLPALRQARMRYASEASARLHCLLALMAQVEDTCLLFRGERSALAVAQGGARQVIDAGIDTQRGRCALQDLERDLLHMNASPGGSADLLAATLFLDRMETTRETARGDT